MFDIRIEDNTNLPAIEQAVTAAAESAMDAALPILGRGVYAITRVKTGFMRDNERTFRRGSYTGLFASDAPYTSFVDKRYPFIDPGIAATADEAVAAYERVFDREMGGFTRD